MAALQTWFSSPHNHSSPYLVMEKELHSMHISAGLSENTCLKSVYLMQRAMGAIEGLPRKE